MSGYSPAVNATVIITLALFAVALVLSIRQAISTRRNEDEGEQE